MRKWFDTHWIEIWFLVIVTLCVLMAAVVFDFLHTKSGRSRYEICVATERFSAAECEYIANVLYVDMWGGEE
jgi:hypothetical protein